MTAHEQAPNRVTSKYVLQLLESEADEQSMGLWETSTEDGLFQTRSKAAQYISDVVEIFETLRRQPTIRLYRAIQLDSLDDLDREYLGRHWSWEEQSALDFGRHVHATHLLVAETAPDNGDWLASVDTFLEHGTFIGAESEDELTVIDELAVELLEVREL